MGTAGILTILGFGFLAAKFGWPFVQKLIGMDWLIDIIGTLGFMWLFAITGTFSGMMTGIAAGVMLSAILFFARKLLPHKKLIRGRWIDVPGEWTGDIQNHVRAAIASVRT